MGYDSDCDSECEIDWDALPMFPTDETINPLTNTSPNCSHEVVILEGDLYVLTTAGSPFHEVGESFKIRHDQTHENLGTAIVIGTHDVKNKIIKGNVPNEDIDQMVFK